MKSSIDYEVKIYTEYGDVEHKYDYDSYLGFLKGTNIIYLEKKDDRILIGVSGINCRHNTTNYNCFFFWESNIKYFSLLDFFQKLINKCNELDFHIENNNLLKFFEFRNRIEDLDTSLIEEVIGEKNFIPSIFIPVEYSLDIIEKTIKSDNISNMGISFINEKIKNVKIDIIYYVSQQKEIRYTKETVKKIEEFKNQKLEEILDIIKKRLKENIVNSLRHSKKNYLNDVAQKIELGKIDINTAVVDLQTDEVINETINKIKIYLKEEFSNIIILNKKYEKSCNSILNDLDSLKNIRKFNEDTIKNNIINIINKNFSQNNIKREYSIKNKKIKGDDYSKCFSASSTRQSSAHSNNFKTLIDIFYLILQLPLKYIILCINSLFIIRYFIFSLFIGILISIVEIYFLKLSPFYFLINSINFLDFTINSNEVILFNYALTIIINISMIYTILLLYILIKRTIKLTLFGS